MAELGLPKKCERKALMQALGELEEQPPSQVKFHVQERAFFPCDGVAFLCAWGLRKVAEGWSFSFDGDADRLRYLARMDLLKHLCCDYDDDFERHPESGRFIAIRLVQDGSGVKSATDAVCDLVLHQFENAGEFLPALEWATNEIIDNVLVHAQTSTPGVVFGQYIPKNNILSIAICDMGRGIKQSLSETRHYQSHAEAIQAALQRGVTRNVNAGLGNGLAGSLEIAKKNGGGMAVWSGDAEYRLRKGVKEDFESLPAFPGTAVELFLNTTRPVSLNDTFIGNSSWTYINAECERIAEQGGLFIQAECLHTGGREPAAALRRKIQALLPELNAPLAISFSGIRSASSSFLDELLGRLAVLLGEDGFKEKVLVTGASRAISDMANVVIQQRLHGLDGVLGSPDAESKRSAPSRTVDA